MTKTEIITAAENIFKQFSATCDAIDENIFYKRHEGKWSVAENIKHLILSINTTTLAYQLPRFLVRWVGGTPNRNSHTYDELLARYNKKLEEGAKASKRYVPFSYVPSPSAKKYGKKILLTKWNKLTSKFIIALTVKRTEEDLDSYLVKHPLLGRITLRELCYFTIFHTEHHLHSIKKITQPHDTVL